MQATAVVVVAAVLVASCQLLLDLGADTRSSPFDAGVDGSVSDASGDASDANCARSDVGPCTDTRADPHHCGRCNHDCLGGPCVDGKCQPVVLLSNLNNPTAIAVEPNRCGEGHIAWVANGCPVDGGVDVLHLTTKDGLDAGVVDRDKCFLDLTATAEHLIWGSVLNVQMNHWDGRPYGLVGESTMGLHTALAGDDVYWATTYENWIMRNKKAAPACSGTTCLAVNVGAPVFDLVATPLGIVFLRGEPDGGSGAPGVYRIVDGGSFTLLVDSQNGGRSMIAVGDWVYWENQGVIRRVQADGGNSATLVAADVKMLAGDERALFWTSAENGGAIWTCDLQGKDPHTLVTGQENPDSIAIDEKAIYWVNHGSAAMQASDGQLMKLARE